MSFPTLFGDASTGKKKMWSVGVEERGGTGVIVVTHGYVDGKKQVNERVVSVGKNIGKKNETTPLAQAMLEAMALWNKKRDSGYSAADAESPAATAAGGAGAVSTTEVVVEVPLPMLAHDYNKRGKSIKFPCIAQRKLDGVRCVAISGKGLYSRNGKAFPHLEHICAEINALPAGTILDGELYSDVLTFQEIVGLVKKETHRGEDAEKMKKIYLYVYDTIRESVTNAERNAWLADLFKSRTFHTLHLLESEICNKLDDLKALHAKYVAEKYEGLILRNGAGLYHVGHRSADLQKYKEFIDEEFAIRGFKEGDGLEKGCVIWRCATASGLEFDCRPRGTREERCDLFAHGAEYIGKLLTVRFQEWTEDGKPRFPVGITIRNYE